MVFCSSFQSSFNPSIHPLIISSIYSSIPPVIRWPLPLLFTHPSFLYPSSYIFINQFVLLFIHYSPSVDPHLSIHRYLFLSFSHPVLLLSHMRPFYQSFCSLTRPSISLHSCINPFIPLSYTHQFRLLSSILSFYQSVYPFIDPSIYLYLSRLQFIHLYLSHLPIFISHSIPYPIFLSIYLFFCPSIRSSFSSFVN